mmetsp:Transcript_31948/g.47684  ORF Transcript_31948/g.47684 Transcript_31948/m.47684 type:complete len:257 (-) Transcript_31948:83-853(-)
MKKHKPRLVNRECNVDRLLSLLHDEKYNTKTALLHVSNRPQSCLIIWTNREKELFNAGFRRYCGCLHMIGKCLGAAKSFKDIVDYHYRFKIPDQFRRYQEKKKVQARKMLEFVEKKRLEGVFEKNGSNSGLVGDLLSKSMDTDVGGFGGSGAMSVSSGASVGSGKRIRQWSKTGGSTDNKATGALEERRVTAKSFLLQTRDAIGEESYHNITRSLKEYNSQSCSLQDLKDSVVDILKLHPTLLEQFLEFLPKKYRT